MTLCTSIVRKVSYTVRCIVKFGWNELKSGKKEKSRYPGKSGKKKNLRVVTAMTGWLRKVDKKWEGGIKVESLVSRVTCRTGPGSGSGAEVNQFCM